MRKLFNIYNNIWQLLFIAMVVVFLPACQEDEVELPVITEVINYAASPNDTVVSIIHVGQWVVIKGRNLKSVTEVHFGNVPATINPAFFTDNSLLVQLPEIHFPSVPKDVLNKIIVANKAGSATYPINVIGLPHITYIRNYEDSPNDTICGSIQPGQTINIIGYNLDNAIDIAFQGIRADLLQVAYTDSSAIVKVPEDLSGGDAALANRLTYTNSVGTGTYSIPIIDPSILEYFNDPLWVMLTGGIGNEKTWVIDFDENAVSVLFNGPIYFSGVDYGWNNQCTVDGGDCWLWDPTHQEWMPGPKDYGTMTFKLTENPVEPFVTVDQRGLSGDLNGIFNSNFFLDIEAKTISFFEIVPLNMGWDQVWTTGYLISLTEDGMQIGFRHTEKAELEIYNYIVKK